MKAIAFFLLPLYALLVLASCNKKSDELNPDSGAEVAGTYTVSQFRNPAGQVGNITNATITITVTRVNENQVTASFRTVPNGQAPRITEVPGLIDLERSGNTITLVAFDGSELATYTSGTLEFTSEDPGMPGTFIGKKQ